MIFDWNTTAALASVQDLQPESPLTLTGEGLWVCLISSGSCTASLAELSPSPAGSALILPPRSAGAGHLILCRAPLLLEPAGEGEASARLAVHLPLEIRQTHSPSPVRVRGSLG